MSTLALSLIVAFVFTVIAFGLVVLWLIIQSEKAEEKERMES